MPHIGQRTDDFCHLWACAQDRKQAPQDENRSGRKKQRPTQ